MPKSVTSATTSAAFLLLAASPVLAQHTDAPTLAPDHPTGVYARNESITFTLTLPDSAATLPTGTYTLKSGGLKEIASGPLTFTGHTATFSATLSEPNTLLATVTLDGKHLTAGAVAGPYEIKPAAEEPADFQAFWDGQLAALKQIPPNPQLTEAAAGKPGVSYYKLTLDNVDGHHVQGQLARPAAGDKFPALLIPQWAGVYPLQKSWAVDRAADGWLTVNLEAHDIPIDNPPDYYQKLYGPGGALNNYWKIGNEKRETSYYRQMYLGLAQALLYLKSRPDWDGHTLVVMGTSQGGQQSLVAAGLFPEPVTACLPFLPAACDNLAPSIGRASGFPNWYTQTDNRDAAAVHETSKYFDPVYFARRIKCPVFTGLGLRDDLAPPSSVLAAVNQITSPKEVLILPTAGHQSEHGSQDPYTQKLYSTWLPALAKAQTPPLPH